MERTARLGALAERDRREVDFHFRGVVEEVGEDVESDVCNDFGDLSWSVPVILSLGFRRE